VSGTDKELSRLSKEIWGESGVPGMRDDLRDAQKDLSHLFTGLKFGLPIFLTLLLGCLGWLGKSTYDLNGQVSTIDGELKELPANLAQQLLHQSKQAIERGDTSAAKHELTSATAFLDDARAKRIAVKPDYFAQASRQLQALASMSQLSDEIHSVRLQLAAYRSALQPPPSPTQKTTPVRQPLVLSIPTTSTTLRKITPGPFFIPPKIPFNLTIDGGVLEGAVSGVTQDLDNIGWTDVIFVNMHIIYRGGPVILQNVRFVNCTFDFTSDQHGVEFAEYVVLDKSTFKVA
jgi:hypothetical protein